MTFNSRLKIGEDQSRLEDKKESESLDKATVFKYLEIKVRYFGG